MKWQWQQLKKQIDYTYARSGLCQRQFKEAKITPDDIKNWDDFRHKVPFTTKQDLIDDQEASPPWGTRLGIPESEIVFTFVTSGTSGRGQEVHADSRQDFDIHIDRVATLYAWCGWEKGDKMMLTLPLTMTPAAPSHFLALNRLGCNAFNLGTYDTKAKLQWMQRFNLNAMFCNPAYLETLTTEAEEMGLDPARDFSIKKMLTAGQAYPLSFVHKMERKWQAKMFDYYGGTQGATGCTCEKGAASGDQRGYYHLLDHIALHEVLNPDTLEPVASGELGEVVVTPLHREASSFLRFRMRDRARYFPPDACDCGRPFPLLEAGTISRYDDMMKIKGMNVWPSAIDEVMMTKDEVAEYLGRVYISEASREKAEITVEFKTNVPPEIKQRLILRMETELRDKTGIGFLIKEATGQLPRYVYKTKRWTDDRVKDLGRKT